jgi:hypothetical protein
MISAGDALFFRGCRMALIPSNPNGILMMYVAILRLSSMNKDSHLGVNNQE